MKKSKAPTEVPTAVKGYKVVEVFDSIQGEGGRQGQWTTFVRFQGCNLKCLFCDTDMTKGGYFTETELLVSIRAHKPQYVVFTGGEPCLQLFKGNLISTLVNDANGPVLGLETNGTLVNPLLACFDYVTVSPKSNEVDLDLFTEYKRGYIDEIRLLVTDAGPLYSILKAVAYQEVHPLTTICLSPLFNALEVNARALEHCLMLLRRYKNPNIRLSIQTHKLLNLR